MSTFTPQSHVHHFVSPAHSRTHSFDLARSSPPESQTRQHEATPPNSVSPPGHGQLQQHGQHLVHQHHQGFALVGQHPQHYPSMSSQNQGGESSEWTSPSTSYPLSQQPQHQQHYHLTAPEERRTDTAGSGSLDRILHSRGAGAFEDERVDPRSNPLPSPGNMGLLTPNSATYNDQNSYSHSQRLSPLPGIDSRDDQRPCSTWGQAPPPSQNQRTALPSPAETPAGGVVWGPPPTDIPSSSSPYPLSSWQGPSASYPPSFPASQAMYPLPSLANDPRFDSHPNYYPPVNLSTSTSYPMTHTTSQDAGFRHQASFHQPSDDFLPQQPFSMPSTYQFAQTYHNGHPSGPSALSPPTSVNSGSNRYGATSPGEESTTTTSTAPASKKLKKEVRLSTGPDGTIMTVTGKVLKTDRPFACDVCTQSFNRRHDLTRHHRTHEEERPWPCTNCTKAFTRKDALRRHLLVKKECGAVVELPKSAAAMRRDREARKQAELSKRHNKRDSSEDETQASLSHHDSQQQQQPPPPYGYEPEQRQAPAEVYSQNRIMPAPLVLPAPPAPYHGQQFVQDARFPYASSADAQRPAYPMHQVDLSYDSPRPPPHLYHTEPSPAASQHSFQQNEQQHHSGGGHSRQSSMHSQHTRHASQHSHHSKQSSIQSVHEVHSGQSSIHSVHEGQQQQQSAHTLSPSQQSHAGPSPHQMAHSLSPHPNLANLTHSPSGSNGSYYPSNALPPISPAGTSSNHSDGQYHSPSSVPSQSPYTLAPPQQQQAQGRLPSVAPSLQYSVLPVENHQSAYPLNAIELTRLPPPQTYNDGQQQQQSFGSQHQMDQHQQQPQQQQQQQEWYPQPLATAFQDGQHRFSSGYQALGAQS